MKNNKKTVTQMSARIRIPRGLPGAGQYSNPEHIRALKDVQRELKARAARDRKNANLRAARKQQRDALRAAMAGSGGANRSMLSKRLKGWASTSTSRMRATTSYHWHAVISVTGTSAQLNKVAQLAGSERVRLKKIGEDNYTAIFIPGVGAGTPRFATGAGDFAALGQEWAEKFRATGATADYHGLAYNTVNTEEFGE